MNLFYQIIKRCAVLWLVLVISLSGVSGTVLCVSEDGHFSFELAHQGHCSTDADHASDEGAVDADLAAATSCCCGDCVDVVLSQHTLSQLTQTALDKHLLKSIALRPLASIMLGSEWAPALVSDSCPHGETPPRIAASLFAQRTTVLRI
jgi:hypothetical protein